MPFNGPFHEDEAVVIKKRVFFTGSVPLIRGQGLCYAYSTVTTDTGETATDSWGQRGHSVAIPSTSNNNFFAGVADANYAAKTGGQWINIYEPGSICEVAIGADTVINTGFFTCSCKGGDVGLFSRPGMHGRGSMVPLQTNASGVLVRVADGSGSITTATLTDTGAFGSVAVGDFVYLIGGGVAATGVADATGVFGKYIVGTQATDTLVLTAATAANGHDNATSAAPNFTAATAVDYYVMSGQQRCLAYLMAGPESGLQEYLATNDTTTVDAMAFGTTHINGAGQTMGAAGDVDIVAQVGGGLKRFVCEGGAATTTAQTITEDAGVTGFIMAGTALASLTVAAAGDHATLVFDALGTSFKVLVTDMTQA